MKSALRIAFAAVAGLFVASWAIAAPCKPSADTIVELRVREEPVEAFRPITLAELQALSANVKRPPHAVLGFYAGSVGYAVQSMSREITRPEDGERCPGYRLEAALVSVDRRIAVGSDLATSPCMLRAATEHYRLHAEAASVALRRFAAGLQARLGPAIDTHIRSRPVDPRELRAYVDSLMDKAVASFTTSIPGVQREVDTEAEIRRLSAQCQET